MMRKEEITKTERIRNKVILPFFVSLSLLLLCISCNRTEVYFNYKELKDGDWKTDEVLSFAVDSGLLVKDKLYDVYVEITNNISYPYKNIWLITEYSKNDSTIIKNEYEFVLADDAGEWKGAGFASLFQSSHQIASRISAAENNKPFSITLRHNMKDFRLHGIEKVGIKITETK